MRNERSPPVADWIRNPVLRRQYGGSNAGDGNENLRHSPITKPAKAAGQARQPSLAFYRKHTESMLRRYLYASMQVGRAPSILGDPVARGWASSRPVRTFEDAVIFVLDIEKCLSQLGSLDRELLSRIVLQEYTQAETATLARNERSRRFLQISAGPRPADGEIA